MDSNQLFQFRAIAECKSITKAAQKLYISQPALSIALNKLESDLGCRLFIRDGKQATLTNEGQKLLEYATIITDTIREAEKYFERRDRNNAVKCLRIGGINYPIISKGCASIEGLYFSGSLVNDPRELRRFVDSGEADLVLADERHLSGVPEAFTRELLYHQSLFLVCPREHILADRKKILITELQEYAVVGHANPHGFTSWIKEIKRVNRCNIREDANLNYTSWRTEGADLSLPYLMNSFGISTVWEIIHNLAIIPVTGEYTERDIYMWYRTEEQERLGPVIKKIRDNTQMVSLADQGYHNLIYNQ